MKIAEHWVTGLVSTPGRDWGMLAAFATDGPRVFLQERVARGNTTMYSASTYLFRSVVELAFGADYQKIPNLRWFVLLLYKDGSVTGIEWILRQNGDVVDVRDLDLADIPQEVIRAFRASLRPNDPPR